MPVIRPSAAVRAAKAVTRQSATPRTSSLASSPTATTLRAFSSTPLRAGGHGPEYDPPTGWLFGVKPGEKYEKEGWEGLFYYGLCGGMAVCAVLYAFKPDTTIQTWALEEARRRLEAEGILEDPDNKRP